MIIGENRVVERGGVLTARGTPIRLGTRTDRPTLWLTHLFSSSTVSDLELQ